MIESSLTHCLRLHHRVSLALFYDESRVTDIRDRQGRLGPGRTHHCLRLLGQCERAVELAIVRATDEQFRPRKKVLAQNDEVIGKIASMRMELDAMRLICYNACDTMDLMGNVAGRRAM